MYNGCRTTDVVETERRSHRCDVSGTSMSWWWDLARRVVVGPRYVGSGSSSSIRWPTRRQLRIAPRCFQLPLDLKRLRFGLLLA